MHSALKKGLSWTLSYGIAFSLPGWALLSRVAHADSEEKPSAGEKEKTKPNLPTKPAAKHKPSKGGDLESEGNEKKEGKESKRESAPRTKDCSDKDFLMKATDSSLGAGPRCDQMVNPLVTKKCWNQFFELLGAAQSNALIANNSVEVEKASQQAAASTVTNGNNAYPNIFPTDKNKNLGPKEDELKKAFVIMSDDNIKDKKQCCQQLVKQAEDLSKWLLEEEAKATKNNREEAKAPKIKPDQVQKLIQTQKAACDQKQNVAAAGAAVVAAPPVAHAQQATEKKESIWPAVWALAAGVLLFFLLYKRKKRNSNPPPTPPAPTTTTTTTGGLTYPTLTTETTGRDTTTGGTTGGTTGATTYPSDITGTSTGREILTGGSGTVTGSTTATTATSTTTTTGSTTASPSYPDLSTGNIPRETGGTVRSISK